MEFTGFKLNSGRVVDVETKRALDMIEQQSAVLAKTINEIQSKVVPNKSTAINDSNISIKGKIGELNGNLLFNGNVLLDTNNLMIKAGTIIVYPKTLSATGWQLCDGTALNRNLYSALFAVLSTTYGAGDGSTTFNVPNYKGLFLRGHGSQDINGRTKAAGTNIGDKQEDQFQGHRHYFGFDPLGTTLQAGWSSTPGNAQVGGGNSSYADYLEVGKPADDATNGTPRTGTETYPANVAVNFYIYTGVI